METLIDRYGSPLYVYELDYVRRACAALTAALPPGSSRYYSAKANPHPWILRTVREAGCLPEVSSSGELSAALAAGFRGADCLYTGPGKTREELRYAISCGVRRYSVESLTDLERLGSAVSEADARAEVLLRVNADRGVPGLRLSMMGVPSQFGIDHSQLMALDAPPALPAGVSLQGFHLYMGTNLNDAEQLLGQFDVALEAASKLAVRWSYSPRVLDLGGGFGHPFARSGKRPDFSGLRAPLEGMLDGYFPNWRRGELELAFESGRYLAGAAGTLVSTVQDVKRSKGRTFVILDSGINHLGGMAGLRRIPRIAPELLPVGAPGETACEEVDVVGPLCTPLDSLAVGAELAALAPGDRVRIPNVGAYGLSGSLVAFLSRDCPVEVVTDGGEVLEASQLQLRRESKGEGHGYDRGIRGGAEISGAVASLSEVPRS